MRLLLEGSREAQLDDAPNRDAQLELPEISSIRLDPLPRIRLNSEEQRAWLARNWLAERPAGYEDEEVGRVHLLAWWEEVVNYPASFLVTEAEARDPRPRALGLPLQTVRWYDSLTTRGREQVLPVAGQSSLILISNEIEGANARRLKRLVELWQQVGAPLAEIRTRLGL